MKPVLVGEDNPYRSDPRYALYPLPERSAGHRLCHRIMGLTLKEYIRTFERMNLCERPWNMVEARATAEHALATRVDTPTVFVLLGAKVCAAFDLEYAPFTIRRHLDYAEHRFVVLPHPSGRSRAWNDPTSVGKARRALRDAGVSVVAAEEAIGD